MNTVHVSEWWKMPLAKLKIAHEHTSPHVIFTIKKLRISFDTRVSKMRKPLTFQNGREKWISYEWKGSFSIYYSLSICLLLLENTIVHSKQFNSVYFKFVCNNCSFISCDCHVYFTTRKHMNIFMTWCEYCLLYLWNMFQCLQVLYTYI